MAKVAKTEETNIKKSLPAIYLITKIENKILVLDLRIQTLIHKSKTMRLY